MSVVSEATTPAPLIARGSRTEGRLAAALAVTLVILYLLLHNPYWVRHGDSEVYLSLARNLAAGEGYRFNGQPVAIVPPLWPLLLAGAMKISTSLSLLKLIPMAATIGFLLISYTLLLRRATPIIAAMCVLTAAMLEPVFSLSFLFFSDSLFAFVAILAVWVALRISDGADSWGWIILLAVLCAVAVAVRWAGLPFFAVIGAAVLHHEKPKWNRRWIALLGLSCVVAVAPRWAWLPFFAFVVILILDKDRRWIAFALAAAATVLTFVVLRAVLKVDESQIDPRYDRFVAGHYSILSETGEDDSYTKRVVHFGEWIGGLLWRPLQTYRISRPLDNLAGWIVSLLLVSVIVRSAKQRQWIWLGGAVYVVGLGINWPDPISRYIIPLAPFILFGTYEAISLLAGAFLKPDWPRLLVLNLFFASVLALNGGLYLLHVGLMRSRHFYETWQGGVHKQMIDAASYLHRVPHGDHEIAISSRMVNFGREFAPTDAYRRAFNFLSARDIVTVPIELSREPDPELIRWLADRNVRYYLYQPPIRVVEHFRPQTIDGEPIDPDDSAWRLYELRDGTAVRLRLLPTGDWPREVPGFHRP